MNRALVALACALICGCGGRRPPNTTAEPSQPPPAAIVRTEPPRYQHIPRGTYRNDIPEVEPVRRPVRSDTTRRAAPRPPEPTESLYIQPVRTAPLRVGPSRPDSASVRPLSPE